MKSAGTLMVAVTLLFAAGVQAQEAAAVDKPYASIVARNMFALVPLPPPDTNPPAPPVDPPPKITPNGIMTIFGKLQALFKVANKGKPGQPAKDDAYDLSEGERQDDIEVVKINAQDGIVTFNNHGTIQELPLVVATSTGAGAPPGGGPGGPPGAAPNPGLNPGFRPPGNMTPADRAIMRSRQSGTSGMNPGFPSNGGNPGAPNLGGNNYQPSAYQAPATQPNIEDQVMNTAREMAIIEQNRIATQPLVDKGLMPPLPPTMLTPPDATAHDGAPLIAPPPGPK
jgi:hypothetical protein